MEDFYKAWHKLQKNTAKVEENQKADTGTDLNEDNLTKSDDNTKEKDISKIVFESPDLKLVIEKSFLKRQKVFRLEDHLFHVKVIPKKDSEPPLITDILDFLHAGLIHILDEIKSFYTKGILIENLPYAKYPRTNPKRINPIKIDAMMPSKPRT